MEKVYKDIWQKKLSCEVERWDVYFNEFQAYLFKKVLQYWMHCSAFLLSMFQNPPPHLQEKALSREDGAKTGRAHEDSSWGEMFSRVSAPCPAQTQVAMEKDMNVKSRGD